VQGNLQQRGPSSWRVAQSRARHWVAAQRSRERPAQSHLPSIDVAADPIGSGALFLRHFVEEIEHRSSAPVVHHHVTPSRHARPHVPGRARADRPAVLCEPLSAVPLVHLTGSVSLPGARRAAVVLRVGP